MSSNIAYMYNSENEVERKIKIDKLKQQLDDIFTCDQW